MKQIRILLAEDHTIVRQGIAALLRAEGDMEVVGEAGDGREALDRARDLRPDVILMDIAMPNLSGLEAVHLIKEAVPQTQIVVLSMHKREAFVHQVLASGALGYVIKASPSSDILEAIRAARRGEYFLSSKISAEVISTYLKSRREKPTVRGYNLLSEREQQVFRLMVEGNTTNQIADVLCVSPKTVEKHRYNVTKKLGMSNLLDLVKYAIKIGIIDPELWED